MKLHYPEHIEEVLQRLETREDKARDQLIHAKAEAQVLRANAKAIVTLSGNAVANMSAIDWRVSGLGSMNAIDVGSFRHSRPG